MKNALFLTESRFFLKISQRIGLDELNKAGRQEVNADKKSIFAEKCKIICIYQDFLVPLQRFL